MIACSLIYENNQGFFWKHNEFFQESNPTVLVDDFDFNRFSFSDFIKYLDHQGVREYYFIGRGKRLERVVAFLRHQSTIDFYCLPFEADRRFLTESASLVFSMLKPVNIDFESLHLEEFDNRRKNGVYQLITGRYPQEFNRHLVKHIVMNEVALAKHLDSSIYRACAINSVLYYQSGLSISCEIPLLCMKATFLNDLESLYKLGQISKGEIVDKYEQFIRQGKLDDGGYKGFADMAFYFDRATLNVIFVDRGGIYKDFSKKYLMSTRLNASFYELINALSLYNHKNKFYVYDDVFSICLFMKDYLQIDTHKSIRFHLIKGDEQALQPFGHLVGIEFGYGYGLYDSKSNKLYKVNAQFIKGFKQLASSQSMKQLLTEKFL